MLIDWPAAAEELKTRPGKFGLVARDVYRSHATRIRDNSRVGFKEGRWEVKVEPGSIPEKGDLYVRYLGPN